MKLENPKVTILIGQDGTTIELFDSVSSTYFAEVKLTPAQLSSALSRLGYTECQIEVHGLERLGKKMEIEKLVFEISEDTNYKRTDKEELAHLCQIALVKEGKTDWTPDNYYGSQDSFFTKDGKRFARVTIRRWI